MTSHTRQLAAFTKVDCKESFCFYFLPKQSQNNYFRKIKKKQLLSELPFKHQCHPTSPHFQIYAATLAHKHIHGCIYSRVIVHRRWVTSASP